MAARKIPNTVSIAGVDPSGGAGVLADVKTMSALGAYACGVVAALTAQNTKGVAGIQDVPPAFVTLQIDTLFADVRIDAVKIGMLATTPIIHAVADGLQKWQPPFVVLDPVMVAKSGDQLLAKEAVASLREALLPLATIITPNLPEAGVLLGERAPESLKEMVRAAEKLREQLSLNERRWVLLTGGHLRGADAIDVLTDGDKMIELPATRIDTNNTHGTGCTLSSAIAALAPQHDSVPEIAKRAKHYVTQAIRQSGELNVGKGHGPVHHFWRLWQSGEGV